MLCLLFAIGGKCCYWCGWFAIRCSWLLKHLLFDRCCVSFLFVCLLCSVALFVVRPLTVWQLFYGCLLLLVVCGCLYHYCCLLVFGLFVVVGVVICL